MLPDEAEAAKWYQLAAEQGDPKGLAFLGMMYDDGRGVVQDKEKAERLFLGAAKKGHAESQVILLNRGYGKGEFEGYVEGVALLRDTAEQGDAASQSLLGVMYANGQGVPQDYVEAVQWCRLAADQGEECAQYNLGLRYSNGQGVPQDYTEAIKWFRLSAAKGYPDAQASLRIMQNNGIAG